MRGTRSQQRLGDREAEAIRYLYAIRALNQHEIAERFHVTQAHVSNLIRKARRGPLQAPRRQYEVLVNGCWEWRMSRSANGYGYIKDGGRQRLAHRTFYERARGPIPPGLDLDHLCRNRACVNPDHLEAVPRAVNLRRGLGTKLTAEQVAEIRRLKITGATQTEIARLFSVRQDHVSRIVRGLQWK